MDLSRQAEGPSTQSSEALRTRPEPPDLTEGWRAEVEVHGISARYTNRL